MLQIKRLNGLEVYKLRILPVCKQAHTCMHNMIIVKYNPLAATKNTKWQLDNIEKSSKSFLIWPILESNFNLQIGKVSFSSEFSFFQWSKLVWVDQTQKRGLELIWSDFCTSLYFKAKMGLPSSYVRSS